MHEFSRHFSGAASKLKSNEVITASPDNAPIQAIDLHICIYRLAQKHLIFVAATPHVDSRAKKLQRHRPKNLNPDYHEGNHYCQGNARRKVSSYPKMSAVSGITEAYSKPNNRSAKPELRRAVVCRPCAKAVSVAQIVNDDLARVTAV